MDDNPYIYQLSYNSLLKSFVMIPILIFPLFYGKIKEEFLIDLIFCFFLLLSSFYSKIVNISFLIIGVFYIFDSLSYFYQGTSFSGAFIINFHIYYLFGMPIIIVFSIFIQPPY